MRFLNGLVGVWGGRRPALTEGVVFELGAARDDMRGVQSQWQVLRLRSYFGIEHATIEHADTGKTKTLAVAEIVAEPGFTVLPSRGDASPH